MDAQPLLHWSAEPLGKLTPVDPGMAMIMRMQLDKPYGLWFSVGDEQDGWRAWCEGNEFGLDRLTCVTEIVFKPEARVCWLRSGEELAAFHRKWLRPMPEMEDLKFMCGPDWERIGREYDAVVIAPYQWEQRFGEMFWYYGWDCASGCVWNTDVVTTRPWVRSAAA